MYKIECKAGKTLPVADALSRLPASYQHDASTVESINNDTLSRVRLETKPPTVAPELSPTGFIIILLRLAILRSPLL
ncbi:hypothetical protein MTO96_019438 [Rhipicephalus appendiculatus]